MNECAIWATEKKMMNENQNDQQMRKTQIFSYLSSYKASQRERKKLFLITYYSQSQNSEMINIEWNIIISPVVIISFNNDNTVLISFCGTAM